jgi:predicted nucleic acid-binding protein
MNVFVDTSAFLAILNPHDPHHKKAAAIWRRLIGAERRPDGAQSDEAVLVTTNYVLVETFAVAQRRLGMEAARAFHEDVTPVLTVVWIDEAVHSAGALALFASGSSRLSLVDCTSFHVMRQRGIKAAFAFDADFEKQGFNRSP